MKNKLKINFLDLRSKRRQNENNMTAEVRESKRTSFLIENFFSTVAFKHSSQNLPLYVVVLVYLCCSFLINNDFACNLQ